MSDYTTTTSEVIFLRPNQIKTDPKYKTRYFEYDPPAPGVADPAQERFSKFMENIEAQGQLEPVLLTPDHVLYAGSRRVKAITTLNGLRSARGESMLKVRCVIDHEGGDYLAKAIATNLHRDNLSPMELAYLFTKSKQQMSYPQLCEYFSLSKWCIISHMQLLKAPKELQNMVHIGLLTADGLTQIMKAEPDNGPAQIRLAHSALERELETRTSLVIEKFENGQKTKRQTTTAIQAVPKKVSRIHRSSVVQAIRDSKAEAVKKIRLSRPEIVNSLKALDVPDISEDHREFIRYLIDNVLTGTGTQQELIQKFLAIGPKPVRLAG